jgi:hypothetical protein
METSFARKEYAVRISINPSPSLLVLSSSTFSQDIQSPNVLAPLSGEKPKRRHRLLGGMSSLALILGLHTALATPAYAAEWRYLHPDHWDATTPICIEFFGYVDASVRITNYVYNPNPARLRLTMDFYDSLGIWQTSAFADMGRPIPRNTAMTVRVRTKWPTAELFGYCEFRNGQWLAP